jgi:hypothetical protein
MANSDIETASTMCAQDIGKGASANCAAGTPGIAMSAILLVPSPVPAGE